MAIISILISESESAALSVISSNDLASLSQSEFSVYVSTLLSLIVGLLELILSVFNAGTFLSRVLFRDSFISSFTVAATINIMTSQLKFFLGIAIPKYNGSLALINTWIYAFSNLNSANWRTFVVGSISVFLMIGIKQLEIVIQKRVRKKYYPEIPADRSVTTYFPEVLFTVIVVSVVASALNLSTKYGVATIGSIPAGLPSFFLPWKLSDYLASEKTLLIVARLIPNVLSLTLVSMVVLASIVRTFPSPALIEDKPRLSESAISLPELTSEPVAPPAAVKTRDDNAGINQEIFAVALSNIFGSFFLCFPSTGSLSKGAILANQTNVRSPVGNFFAVIVVGIVVTFLTSWFEGVPMAVLAALVLVALFPVLLKITQIRPIFQKALDKWRAPLEPRDHGNTTLTEPESIAMTMPPYSAVESINPVSKGAEPSEDVEAIDPIKSDPDELIMITSPPTESAVPVNPVISALISENLKPSISVESLNSTAQILYHPPASTPLTKTLFFFNVWDDVFIWIATFISVVIADVGTATYVGIACVLFVKFVTMGLEWGIRRRRTYAHQ